MFNSLSVEITNLVRKQFKYYFIVYKYLIHENTRDEGRGQHDPHHTRTYIHENTYTNLYYTIHTRKTLTFY